MKAIVLAGGKGSRLAPYTHILPKPLVPIGDMPILEVLIRQMKRHGIEEVILTVGHLSHLLESYFGDGSKYGMHISYSHEEEPLGTAGPLSLIQGLENTFIVTNGDVLTTLDLSELIQYHKAKGASATIAMYERNIKIDLGVIHVNGGNEVQGYDEKPNFDYKVSMGIYVFEPRVLDYIPNGKYLDFPDLVKKLLANNELVMGYPFEGYWQDLGRADDYAQARDDFEELKPELFGENY
ncbi:MAG: NTP transferase domain-containing protein [Chloroflexi bacterium]|nr:NTP transferase domain-containing protein [Chloroflexota bacterium]